MAEKFYSFIIEEEKKEFNIGNKSLKAAAQSIGAYHSVKSLGKRQSLQPSAVYDKPQNRCHYLYRYAVINSRLVTKYFRKIAFQKEVKNTFKKTIKVCCLGGGPGTDVYGVFKALAVKPYFDGKITEVSVLDICSGWKNMFSNVISRLLEGKVKNTPAAFINQENFTYKLITVDLLDNLPQNVKEIISSADIVCMTRFVSEILGDERSSSALKVLGNLIKLGALVLYVDIFNKEVFELSEDIFKTNVFETVFGPLHEQFVTGSTYRERNVYGYDPQYVANFTIVGWRKTSIANTVFKERYSITYDSATKSEVSSDALKVFDSESNSTTALDGFDSENNSTTALDGFDSENNSTTALDGFDSENNSTTALDVFDSENNSTTSLDVFDSENNSTTALDVFDSENNSIAFDGFDSHNESLNEPFHSLCHTSTQTESDLSCTVSSENEEMLALMKAISNLINITEQWKQKFKHGKCCCCHQYHSC